MRRAIIIESKTSAQDIEPGSKFWNRVLLDVQIGNYVEGVRSLGYEPDGVLYDVTRKISIEPHKATPVEKRKYTKESKTEPSRLYAGQRDTDETLEEYRDRCIAEVSGNVDKYYQRRLVVRLEDDEKRAALDTWQTAQTIRDAQRLDRWPHNPDACELYNRTCDFWHVCIGAATIDDDQLFETSAQHAELDTPRRHTLPLITTSSAKSFRACPRKYYYAYELRRRPRERSHALRFGTLFHAGLEAWWTTRNIEAAITAIHESAVDQMLDEWDLVRAEVLLTGYDHRWRDEPLRTEAVEIEFEAPLINPRTGHASKTWVRGGKLDAVATVIESEQQLENAS